MYSFLDAGTWNDDVLTEILLRLPAKSLIRFKSVCKLWFTLISSHHFSYLHTLRSPKPESSLLLQTRRTSKFFYFHPTCFGDYKLIPYEFNLHEPKILSSCNGLLLLQSDHHYYVYNATTKQSRKIVLASNDKYTHVLGLNLAFNPSKSPYYKIVCVRAVDHKMRYFSSRFERCCLIELYDSETLAWKVCLEPISIARHVNFCTGVYYNDVIHWDNYPRSHLYFDISKNVVGNLPNAKIPWPEGNGGGAVHCQLEESNGYLHHFIIVSDHGEKSIAVFELVEDYSQWLLKHHEGFGRPPGAFRILSFIRGDGEETSMLVFHLPGKINVCQFVDKSFKELVDLTKESFYQEGEVQFDREYYHFCENLTPI